MIDGSIIRAHQHAAGAIGGQDKEALGRSRGGFSTKIHAKVDALGMPLGFVLTGGAIHEVKTAPILLDKDISEYLIADKAYDSNEFRIYLSERGTKPVIPPRSCRLIQTEYDKLAATFMGALNIASILIWLK
ncbi:IS5/IS1182 family transposase [Legionella spiritensis]|uniref:Transposase n=1 Tax=Legionella spiritensis TaxID=452 RepID=A0A0W0Z5R8_LEGSP|nr:IS5/IS1182 family transposase [Legionella spiritensis]KTD64475.1 transposase [Legionella spiritensis]SNV45654.1 transposase [Legionella spiritensis]